MKKQINTLAAIRNNLGIRNQDLGFKIPNLKPVVIGVEPSQILNCIRGILNHKSLILIFIIVNCQLSIINCFSQSFTPNVIGSAGTFATSASGSMSWTIGEVMTETYSSVGNFFTQGFHQSESIAISVNEISSSQNISIYPNPVVDHLMIDFSGASISYSLYVYDMLGQKVYEVPANNSTLQGGGQTINISFRQFANGVYFLNIINTESNTRSSYKINKAE